MYKLCILLNYGWKFMFVNLKLFDLFLKYSLEFFFIRMFFYLL